MSPETVMELYLQKGFRCVGMVLVNDSTGDELFAWDGAFPAERRQALLDSERKGEYWSEILKPS